MLTINIQNDGKGDGKIGFYKYTVLVNGEVIDKGGVNFHVRKHGWITLLEKVRLDARKREVNAQILGGTDGSEV